MGITEEREERPGVFHVVVAPHRRVVGEAARGEHHAPTSGVDRLGDAQLAEGEGAIELGDRRFQAQVTLEGGDMGTAARLVSGGIDRIRLLPVEPGTEQHGEG